MNLQSKLIGACVGALVLFASPAVQASPVSYNAASAVNASTSAAQSAVRAMRDDIARRKVAERVTRYDTRTR